MATVPDTIDERTWYGATTVLALSLVCWLLAGPVRNEDVYVAGVDLIAALLLLAATRSSRAGRNLRRVVAVIVTAFVASGIITQGSQSIAIDVTTTLVLMVGLAVPTMIGRDIVRRGRIDAHLVLGAITIYLLLGILFSMVLATASNFVATPLFVLQGSPADGAYRDQVYFSFVTLSTTGYGDIVPNSGTARAIAILTALTGQLYLVTAVATAVSLFSASRFTTAPEQSSVADSR